jgi:hypothetical protein
MDIATPRGMLVSLRNYTSLYRFSRLYSLRGDAMQDTPGSYDPVPRTAPLFGVPITAYISSKDPLMTRTRC